MFVSALVLRGSIVPHDVRPAWVLHLNQPYTVTKRASINIF